MSNFVSFSMTFIVPVAFKSKEVEVVDDLEAVHEYVLAKLDFLLSLFRNQAKLVKSYIPLIVQFLPDFFYYVILFELLLHFQIDLCRQKELDDKAEQVEVLLSKLCKSLEREKEIFHRYAPFILTDILGSLKRNITFPTYILLSLCNEYDLALLSTNLPSLLKHKFATIYAQFYKQNEIIG